MIDLFDLKHWVYPKTEVVVVAGGWFDEQAVCLAYYEGLPVIACNDAAYRLSFVPDIHLAMDRPYWRASKPYGLGVWVRPGNEPLPRKDWNAQAVVQGHWDHWSHDWGKLPVAQGGGTGPCAINLAIVFYGAQKVRCFGFSKHPKYAKINESLETLKDHVELEFA